MVCPPHHLWFLHRRASLPKACLFCLALLCVEQGISLLIGQFERTLRPACSTAPLGIRTIRLGTDRQAPPYLMGRVLNILLSSTWSRAFSISAGWPNDSCWGLWLWGLEITRPPVGSGRRPAVEVACNTTDRMSLAVRNLSRLDLINRICHQVNLSSHACLTSCARPLAKALFCSHEFRLTPARAMRCQSVSVVVRCTEELFNKAVSRAVSLRFVSVANPG